MFGRAWKALASRRPFAACLAPLCACQRPFLVTHVAQPLAQRLKVIKLGIIDFGMVTAQDDLMLIETENAAFEFAGYGHDYPRLSFDTPFVTEFPRDQRFALETPSCLSG